MTYAKLSQIGTLVIACARLFKPQPEAFFLAADWFKAL